MHIQAKSLPTVVSSFLSSRISKKPAASSPKPNVLCRLMHEASAFCTEAIVPTSYRGGGIQIIGHQRQCMPEITYHACPCNGGILSKPAISSMSGAAESTRAYTALFPPRLASSVMLWAPRTKVTWQIHLKVCATYLRQCTWQTYLQQDLMRISVNIVDVLHQRMHEQDAGVSLQHMRSLQ